MTPVTPAGSGSINARGGLPSAVLQSTRRLYGFLRGERKRIQSVSMTLDIDDVRLARSWLRRRTDWRGDDLVRTYERDFASWNDSAFAFAFMGGRRALSACIEALGLGRGDEVIVPGFTCVVVPNAFRFAGVEVKYCDIELETFGPDVASVEARIGSRTRAIVVHHLFGLVCRDYEAIVQLARNRNIRVIEDCAHATGARFRGRRVGNLGDIAFYSSERSKVFNTIVGGMAVTNDPELARGLERAASQWALPDDNAVERQLHNVILDYYCRRHPMSPVLCPIAEARHGWARCDSTTEEELAGRCPPGYFTRMPNPVAALGLHQLGKIDRMNALRRATAQRWDAWCSQNGYRSATVVADSEPVYLRYPVLVPPQMKRDPSWASRDLGIVLGLWFVTNLHPALEPVAGCPNADIAVESCVNLPTILE
ncbi:MAG: aminotransferase class I/II-fold pyridoxal phosphate-dependent enzyme [Acidobacteria bacterium]|nr:aminotransferase class I/II-fold pyridoxal phosphate-dependent enzyme [Acidobacteriota bacterium]